MDDLSDLIRREAAGQANAYSAPRIAVVTSYNSETYAVKVKLQPEDKETGWAPLGSIHVGNGTGIAAGAEEGDQVIVVFSDGDHSTPQVIGRIFSDKQKAPKVKSGEIAVHHKSGTNTFYSEDGSLTRTHAKGQTQTWMADGTHVHDNKDKAVNTAAASMRHETPTQVVTGAIHIATG